MKKYLSLLATVVLLVGCSKTPMQELKSDTATNHSNSVFWHKEMNQKTPLWQQAKTYCAAHPQKPNCSDVQGAVDDEIIASGSTDVPAYGSSGHYLHVPNF